MDFAHETKKRTHAVMEARKEPDKEAIHAYPYSSFWDLLHQCDSVHPLLRKNEL